MATKHPWRVCFLPALFCLALAAYLPDSHLLPLRAWAWPALVLLALAGLGACWVLAGPGGMQWRGRGTMPIALAWLTVLGLALHGQFQPDLQRHALLALADREPGRLATLGEHLVVGYDEPGQVRELARLGLIGGLFISRRNIEGKSPDQLRVELADLQAVRRQAGRPPLMVATDQEGGPVSRLAPLLPRQPPLSSVIAPGRSSAGIEARAQAYGEAQGRALADLGFNANFSPVVDLKPAQPAGALDFHTRIAERAIAPQPDTVSRVALAYSRGLHGEGVMPTLKHFPGLGGVTQDTHHFTAHLDTPLETLAGRDWVPFRRILGQTPAMLMVGHVMVDALDKTRPASLSRPVIHGLIRVAWGFDGVLISDDMTMAAVYDRGLCSSAVDALNAGVDLLLVAYDWEKYFQVMLCLDQAQGAGSLALLEESQARLARLPWRGGG